MREVGVTWFQHTHGLFGGRRIKLAKKIDEAAISDGA